MAYIVLALGVLMALVGLGAIVTGYPVIEVERGWAMVISGAVLLSGGFVTAALGLVVRQLAGLKGTRMAQDVAGHSAEAPDLAAPDIAAPDIAAPDIAAPDLATQAPDAPAMPIAASFAAATPYAPALAAAVPVATAAAFTATRPSQQSEAPAVAAEMPSAPTAEPEPEYFYEEPAAAEHHELDDTSLFAEELVHPPHEQGPAAQTAVSHPPQHEAHPLESDAWLDQAFRAFDYELTGGHPPPDAAEPATPYGEPETSPKPSAHTAAHEEPLSEGAEAPLNVSAPLEHPAHEEAAIHPPVPATPEPAAEPVAAAPDAAPNNLSVIGRYDSDGTSYVMYSDGSIEAQSEAGVYRFGSMAELKAFIEG